MMSLLRNVLSLIMLKLIWLGDPAMVAPRKIFVSFMSLAFISVSGCAIFSGKQQASPTADLAYIRSHHTTNPADKLHAKPPSTAAIYTALGSAYLQRGHPRAAIQDEKKALRYNVGHGSTYDVLGLSYALLMDNVEAGHYFRKAIDASPNNPMFLNDYGAFLLKERHYHQAILELHRATLNPLYSTPEFAWTNLAAAYAGLHENKHAVSAIQRALYFRPNYAPALALWSRIEYQRHQLRSADRHIQTVLVEEPTNGSALLLAGEIAVKMGNTASAKTFFKRCITAAPFSFSGRKAQQKLLDLENR